MGELEPARYDASFDKPDLSLMFATVIIGVAPPLSVVVPSGSNPSIVNVTKGESRASFEREGLADNGSCQLQPWRRYETPHMQPSESNPSLTRTPAPRHAGGMLAHQSIQLTIYHVQIPKWSWSWRWVVAFKLQHQLQEAFRCFKPSQPISFIHLHTSRESHNRRQHKRVKPSGPT